MNLIYGSNAQVWIGCDLNDAQALGLTEDGELQAWQRMDAEIISIDAEVVRPPGENP